MTIAYEDFQLLDIRVGTVLRAEPFPKAKKSAYRLLIDFGPLGLKPSSAQLTKLYTLDQLVGKPVLAVVNLAPRQVANFISEVLVLGVVENDNAVVLLQPQSAVVNGTLVK